MIGSKTAIVFDIVYDIFIVYDIDYTIENELVKGGGMYGKE